VCSEVQNAVKSAIETMTSLKVVEVNVLVQNVTFDEPEKPEKKKDRPEIEARVR